MLKTRPITRRCNPSKAPKFVRYGWTMTSIKGTSTAAGQYFFSRATRKFFGPEKFSGPYEGPGGVYFVKYASRTGTAIYRFDPKTGSIDFERFAADGEALADVRNAAKALARGTRANPSLADLRAGASRAYHAAAPHVRRAASATASGARRAYHAAAPKVKAGTRRALLAVSDYSARGARALDEGAHRCNPAVDRDDLPWVSIDLSPASQAKLRKVFAERAPEVYPISAWHGSEEYRILTRRKRAPVDVDHRGAPRFEIPKRSLAALVISLVRSGRDEEYSLASAIASTLNVEIV